MKFKTLFTMDYAWAYRYLKKRAYQRLHYWRAGDHYDVTVNGITVRLNFSSPYHHSIAQHMAQGRYDELPLMHDWVDYAKDAKLIFDVGGFNGIYGLLAKKSNPDAKVYVFEGDFVNVDHIRQNARANDLDIEVVAKAVTDHRRRH